MKPSYLHFLTVLALAAVGCATESSDDNSDSTVSDVSALKSYWSDAKRLDLGDLSRISAGFATEALNDQLGGNATGVGVRFQKANVFAATAETNRLIPNDYEIKGLDKIVDGLAYRFGENELSTEVNSVRLAHLKSTQDDYFVESGFTLRGGLAPNWNFDAGGLGIRLGFDAGAELTSRVILASRSDGLKAMVTAPLAAAKGVRGFVYPRSMRDISSMKPGEMFALRGLGKLGANFGVGAPIFVAEPTGGLAYRIVVSAGVSTVVSGQLDVQLVRMNGDEVVVDLGVENGKGVSFNASISDSWGVKGICDDGEKCLRAVELAGRRVDLGRLVEKAIESQMNKYLTFRVEASQGLSSSRVSLSRFRLHLDRGNPDETSRALEQLLKFDLRLAQAISNRDLGERAPAVTQEFDAVRAATTSTRNFGFEVLGMNIYHRAVVDREGTFVLQTPEGARAVLFDYLREEGGWFQRKHAYSRTGIGAQTVSLDDPSKFRPGANLFMQTMSADTHMNDDFMIDNIDALILGVAGKDAVDALDVAANELERTVWSKCPVAERTNGRNENTTQTWNERCNVQLLDEPIMKSLFAKGLAAIEPKMADLPEATKELIRTAATVRLKLQSVGIHGFSMTGGPAASISVDVRLDDRGLDQLTSKSREQYIAAVSEYMATVRAQRRDVRNPEGKAYFGRIADREYGEFYEKMADRYVAGSRAYRAVTEMEKALPEKLAGKRFISHPLGIRFTMEADERRMLESAVIKSTSHERAVAAASLFDGIYDQASKFRAPLDPEQATMFPLLALVPAKNAELRLDVGAKVDSNFLNPRKRFEKVGFKSVSAVAKGPEVQTLGGGMFDLAKVASEP